MIKHTPCRIHTFDCTSGPPSNPLERHTFHKECMGADAAGSQLYPPTGADAEEAKRVVDSYVFKRYNTIVQEAGLKFVDVLKMGQHALHTLRIRLPLASVCRVRVMHVCCVLRAVIACGETSRAASWRPSKSCSCPATPRCPTRSASSSTDSPSRQPTSTTARSAAKSRPQHSTAQRTHAQLAGG
jgi:hypothetical protein